MPGANSVGLVSSPDIESFFVVLPCTTGTTSVPDAATAAGRAEILTLAMCDL
jgi:hypothetical protein